MPEATGSSRADRWRRSDVGVESDDEKATGSTDASSGPRSSRPISPNHPRSPEERKRCAPCPGLRRPRPISERITRTSKAVSSADETKSTVSRPMTSAIVRARKRGSARATEEERVDADGDKRSEKPLSEDVHLVQN